jgi:hypothetical protein
MNENNLIACTKVRLQLEPEMSEFINEDIERAKKLCEIFGFWFELVNIDNITKTLFINIIYVSQNSFYSADFSTIIKTFALQNGYFILGSESIHKNVDEDD